MENKTKKQKRKFLDLLTFTLGARLSRNILVTTGLLRSSVGFIWAIERVLKVGQDF